MGLSGRIVLMKSSNDMCWELICEIENLIYKSYSVRCIIPCTVRIDKLLKLVLWYSVGLCRSTFSSTSIIIPIMSAIQCYDVICTRKCETAANKEVHDV